MAIKKFKVNASKQAKSIKKRIIASELLSGVDKLPERGKVITKTIKGDPVVIVGIGDNKYMYKSYLNKASASGDVQFIRNLIKKGEVPANAVKNLGYKLYTSSGSVESACGKKSVKASSSLKVKPYVINKGQSGEYYGLKNAEDNQVLHSAPNNWKSEKGAINWAKKKGYDVVDSACGKKSVKACSVLCADSYAVKDVAWVKDEYTKSDIVKYPYINVTSGKPSLQRCVIMKAYMSLDDAQKNLKSDSKDFYNKYGKTNWYIADYYGSIATIDNPYYDGIESSKSVKKFGIKASKSAKKRVAAAKGYWADDINAENYRKILQALDDYLIANYDGKTIGGVEIGVSKLRSVKNGIGSKIEIMFYCPDYNKDTKLEIITAPELRSKFLGRVSAAPFKFDDEFMIRQSGCKQVVVDKIDEIADMLSNGSIEGACGKKRTVKASHSAKRRKAIKASGIQNDIVMYFNGDNVYQGSVYDLADAVENLCYDDEVNAKFQEWCNQFGDPFDFDGSPIDTARVFTDIIIHEAEESPVSEDGQSEFYEDGDGILDFEIFYADEFSIDGAKSIKCSSSDNYNDLDETMRFRVCNYYDTKFRDLAECKVFDDFDEAVDYAHECLGKGPTTIEDYYVGTVEIDPDEYWDNFDGEFWCTPELADFRDEVWKSMGIGASTDITAALNKKSDINDEQYNQALADEVADMLRADGFEDIEVSVAPEAISFFINDEVMFVQPTNMITPNMADIYDDCTELFNAVKEATTDKMWKLYDNENKAMRDAWEDPDIDDPDYATRAVTLSRKAKGKDISAAEETIDIDDLDYISGDDEQEDWGYGFDSNGDPIDESTVDELCRIANEILEKSELVKQYDEYASIDRDTFDYYMSSPHVNEKFYIYFTFTKDGQWLLDNGFVEFGDSWVGWNVAEDYTFECDILVENGEVKDILYNDVPDNHSAELIDMPAVTEFIEKLASGVAMDIYNGTTNL